MIALGADGSHWLNSLDDLVRELENDWDIRIGLTLHGGSEALVTEAKLANGMDAVVGLQIRRS